MFNTKKTLKNNIKVLTELNSDLRKSNVKYQEERNAYKQNYEDLKEINIGLENEIVLKSQELKDAKNEIKRLKQLLTRNNIEYRKEV